jgi:hypothetical protein
VHRVHSLGARRRVGAAAELIANTEGTGPGAGAETPGRSTGRRIRHLLHRGWWYLCGSLLVVLLAARWLRYLTVSPPPAVDHLLGSLMIFSAHLFLWPWALTSIVVETGVVIIAVLPLFLMRRRLVRRVDGVWRFTPLLTSLLCAGMLWMHYLFDVNVFVASLCAASLALAWGAGRLESRGRTTGARLTAAGGVAVLCTWLALAGDSADRWAVVLWAFVLLVGRPYAARMLGEREVWLSLLLAVIPLNLLPAVIPLSFPSHGGTRFGDGLAYSFCEAPKYGMLFASLPACTSVNSGYGTCGQGRVVGYERATLKPVRTHGFFSPDYYGRVESLVCLDDEIQVAVQATRYHGRRLEQTALSFPLAPSRFFTPLVAGDGVGSSIAYDEGHDALFYAGEYTHRIVRYDRRTGRTNDRVGEPFRRRFVLPLDLKPYTGSLVMLSASIHPGRNRLYLADWMHGRYAYALDLTTLELVGRYDVQDGGNLGLSVDAERDRLFVVGLWGMEVFDLATETLIARKRLGLGNRPVVIDPERNRLYVSSSVEGKIRVLDRDTFRTIGQVAIGLGTRYPYLSLDRQHFFASSSVAHYVWDPDAL